jgi:riboflavin biosynthesis pyrimidine reductase
MAKLVFGMNLSLDGYVDHLELPPPRDLKARLVGEITVSGPKLAQSLTDLGLIDEYRLYFHPIVLGRGTPFFAGPRLPLRFVSTDLVGEDTIRLTYVPA